MRPDAAWRTYDVDDDVLSVDEARVERAVVAARMAIGALTGSDYVSSTQVAHADTHLCDALSWLRKAPTVSAGDGASNGPSRTMRQIGEEFIAAHPDPADGVAHTLSVYADEPDDAFVIVASGNVYGDGVRTGLTWGDLRRLAANVGPVKSGTWPNRDWDHSDLCDANGCRHGCCPCLGEPHCTPLGGVGSEVR